MGDKWVGAGKAQYWADAGGIEAASAMRDALAAIGVRNARRVADAISRLGSDAYVTPSGPVLELCLSSLKRARLRPSQKHTDCSPRFSQ
jgi:hypothetical protein